MNETGERPSLTDEQRMENLRKATVARQLRAAMKHDLKEGTLSVEDALEQPIAFRMPVVRFLESCPNISRAKAMRYVMDRMIPDQRRIGGLNAKQRADLIGFVKDEASRGGGCEEL